MAKTGLWRDLSIEEFLGGPISRHGRAAGIWARALPWVLLSATLTWIILMMRQIPCLQTKASDAPNTFYRVCYTDITSLYQSRELGKGANPFAMEYPVLNGAFVSFARSISALLGAKQGETTGNQLVDATNIFFGVNAFFLFAAFIVLVYAHVKMSKARRWDALLIAIAPIIWFTGLINWDMLCIALASLGILAWARKKPALAGALWGLGIATKLYPFLFFIPLFFLCLRAKKIREFAIAVAACITAWAIPNGALYLIDKDAWMYFWDFNVKRGADFGSIWYILQQAGIQLTDISTFTAALNVLGAVALGVLVWKARRRPRFGQLLFLMVCWFLIVNKVYSPQYVLWLLPLVVLARPTWRHWCIWMIGEIVYTLAVWGHIAGTMKGAAFDGDRLYWASVFIRIGVQLWLMAIVVRDILDPRMDPIRAQGLDDPIGGVLTDDPPEDKDDVVAHPVDPKPSTPPVAYDAPLKNGGLSTATSHRFLLQTWLGSRGVLLLMALFVMWQTGRSWTDVVANWDVQHFLRIARQGYQSNIDPAFFPGLPLLMKGLSFVGIPGVAAGMVISLVCSALAGWALYRLGGHRSGPWAAALWFFAPTAVFTFVPYTESLFCALAFWAWERARKGHWWAMGALAGGACLVRVSGVFLVIALFVLILTSTQLTWAKRALAALWLAIPTAVVGGLAAYHAARTGDWMAWYTAQQTGWARTPHWPWESFANTVEVVIPGGPYADKPLWDWMFRGELISMFAGMGATILLIVRKRYAEATWIGIQVAAFSVSYWWMSVNRAVLLWFPLWLLLGQMLGSAVRGDGAFAHPLRRVAAAVGCVTSLIVMVLWSHAFYTGQWSS